MLKIDPEAIKTVRAYVDEIAYEVFEFPQQNLWGDSGSGSRPKL
jgi:hypothetical protein